VLLTTGQEHNPSYVTSCQSLGVQSVASRKIQPVSDAPSAEMLTPDAFVLVYHGGSLFAWLGSHLPNALRSGALSVADELCASDKPPEGVRVEVVKQGLEGPEFCSAFDDWSDVAAAARGEAKRLQAEAAVGDDGDAPAASRRADAKAMAQGGVQPEPPVDDGTGAKQVRRVVSSRTICTANRLDSDHCDCSASPSRLWGVLLLDM
jgi:hypothetical protein